MRIKLQIMMSLKNQLVVVFVFFLHSLFAQYFEFQWSDKIEYSNNKNGFFTGYINTNDKHIYTLNRNYAVSPLHKSDKIKLTSYDKATMTEVASVAVRGFLENEASKNDYLGLDFCKALVTEDNVLVFWTKLINTDSTKTEELYVESFKLGLERDKKIRKVYSTVEKVDVEQSPYSPSMIVVSANKETENVLIGSELHQDGKNVVFRYMILSSQLGASHEHQISLPSKSEKEPNGVTSTYVLGNDGNIYIRSTVMLNREELKAKKPNDPKSFLILTVINPLSKYKITLEMKGDNKTITDFSYLVTGTKTKLYGFFGDLLKDPNGIDKQGVFYTEIDSDTLTDVKLNYSYFEKTSLNKLFPKSKGGRKKPGDADKQSKEEELNTRFDIENIFLMEDGNVVLFFTRKYNYSEITSKSDLDGNNIYKTDYYCEKNNVSAIRITDAGKILWTSNIERSITYKGTDISDVRVIYKLNKFYVIYGIEYGTENESRKSKKLSEYRDNIDYVTFDPVSGRSKKLNLPVNAEDVLKQDRRVVDPKSVTVYDGNFYFSKMIVKQKLAWYIANVLFVPTIYYSVLSGNPKHASGDLGVLCLMPGKPNKKKAGKK